MSDNGNSESTLGKHLWDSMLEIGSNRLASDNDLVDFLIPAKIRKFTKSEHAFERLMRRKNLNYFNKIYAFITVIVLGSFSYSFFKAWINLPDISATIDNVRGDFTPDQFYLLGKYFELFMEIHALICICFLASMVTFLYLIFEGRKLERLEIELIHDFKNNFGIFPRKNMNSEQKIDYYYRFSEENADVFWRFFGDTPQAEKWTEDYAHLAEKYGVL